MRESKETKCSEKSNNFAEMLILSFLFFSILFRLLDKGSQSLTNCSSVKQTLYVMTLVSGFNKYRENPTTKGRQNRQKCLVNEAKLRHHEWDDQRMVVVLWKVLSDWNYKPVLELCLAVAMVDAAEHYILIKLRKLDQWEIHKRRNGGRCGRELSLIHSFRHCSVRLAC